MNNQCFLPHILPTGGHATATLAITGASARVALPAGEQVLVQYEGAGAAFRFGTDNTVAAVATDIRLPANGGSMIFTVPAGATHIAAIGAGTLYLTGGQGL